MKGPLISLDEMLYVFWEFRVIGFDGSRLFPIPKTYSMLLFVLKASYNTRLFQVHDRSRGAYSWLWEKSH